jgi:hypothetical protein
MVEMKKQKKPPLIIMVLFDLLLLLGLGGIAGGAAFLLAPDGHIMGMPVEQLKNTPFSNYFIPGLLLFLFMGIYPFFTAYSLYRLPNWRFFESINPYKNMHWAWAACLLAGAAVSIWITVQVELLGFISPLQPIYFFYGLIIIIITLFPNVRRYLQL